MIGVAGGCLTGGFVSLVFLFVYIGLTAYHYSNYKKVRTEVINLLNGVPLGRESKVRFKLALGLSF